MEQELITETVELPGGDLRILQPAEAAELPDSGGVEWAPMVDYWTVMWRSGVALARELAAEDMSGLRVVELGCGLGVPSLAAARAGADVLATDVDPEPLELLARNAEENGLALETATADWYWPESILERGPFDLAIAADVLYLDPAAGELVELMPRLAREVRVADPGRPGGEDFLQRASLRWEVETRTYGIVRVHRFTID